MRRMDLTAGDRELFILFPEMMQKLVCEERTQSFSQRLLATDKIVEGPEDQHFKRCPGG